MPNYHLTLIFVLFHLLIAFDTSHHLSPPTHKIGVPASFSFCHIQFSWRQPSPCSSSVSFKDSSPWTHSTKWRHFSKVLSFKILLQFLNKTVTEYLLCARHYVGLLRIQGSRADMDLVLKESVDWRHWRKDSKRVHYEVSQVLGIKNPAHVMRTTRGLDLVWRLEDSLSRDVWQWWLEEHADGKGDTEIPGEERMMYWGKQKAAIRATAQEMRGKR